MQTKKLYIKSIQNLSFKAFAIIAFVCVFITQRLNFLSVRELEMSNVSDSFGFSDIALGRLSKFFDYFGVGLSAELELCTYLGLAALVCGLAVLAMSFFGYRIVQVVNFITAFAGFVLSILLGVMFTVVSAGGIDGDVGEIMSVSVNFIVWLPAVFFLIGAVFTYAYAKMPGYSPAEGRFFTTLRTALNPKYFIKTFRRYDDTEGVFRAKTPLKKKKYATIREPKAIKNSKKKAAQKSSGKEPTANKKLTRLELALAKREHAERIANVRADEENRAMFVKQNNRRQKITQREPEPKPVRKGRPSSASPSAKALELAKRRAEHAEEVVSRNDEIFY